MRKQKLFNKGNSVLSIDSTSAKVNPDANIRIEIIKNRVLDVQNKAKNEVISMLYIFMSSSFSLNNSFVMNRACENDKKIALAKARGFNAVDPPKKNRKFPWLYDKQLYK